MKDLTSYHFLLVLSAPCLTVAVVCDPGLESMSNLLEALGRHLKVTTYYFDVGAKNTSIYQDKWSGTKSHWKIGNI